MRELAARSVGPGLHELAAAIAKRSETPNTATRCNAIICKLTDEFFGTAAVGESDRVLDLGSSTDQVALQAADRGRLTHPGRTVWLVDAGHPHGELSLLHSAVSTTTPATRLRESRHQRAPP
ncbi:hypothetical protein AB0F91_45755 [Amycolatopsis sp. NPDC023774]|uniref:hypothetical protein n=1 Tax=Amycolatopsis sp. NPDC023774 TaxID=3155015 RepID=UPI0033E438E6